MSKPAWLCRKCGLGAHSKCPDGRSVFAEGKPYLPAVRSLVRTFEATPAPNAHGDVWDVSLNMRIASVENDSAVGDLRGLEDDEVAKAFMVNLLLGLTREDLGHFVCSHEWVKNSKAKTFQKCELGCRHATMNPETWSDLR